MIHKMRLHTEPFEGIKSGKQKIETRLFDEKRRLIKVGDRIVFLKRPEEKEEITVEVIKLAIFKSFEDLFNSAEKTLFGYPEEASLENQITCMRKYYSLEDEGKYGVVGMYLKTIDNLIKKD